MSAEHTGLNDALHVLRLELDAYKRGAHPLDDTALLDRIEASLNFIEGRRGALHSYLESDGYIVLHDPGNDADSIADVIANLLRDERDREPQVRVQSFVNGDDGTHEVAFVVTSVLDDEGRIVPPTQVVEVELVAEVAQKVVVEVPLTATYAEMKQAAAKQATWYHEVRDIKAMKLLDD
jgi:acyl-CoA hydrolase